MMRVGFALVLVFVAGMNCAATRLPEASISDGAQLAALVERWRTRDGAAFQEVGHALSEFFVKNEALFVETMGEHPADWESWLDGLQNHTFTAFEPAQVDGLKRLRRDMLKRAKGLRDDRRLGSSARELTEAINATRIRTVD